MWAAAAGTKRVVRLDVPDSFDPADKDWLGRRLTQRTGG